MKILVLNSGSSNDKLSLYDIEKPILSQPQPSLWNTVYERKSPQSITERKNEIREKLKQIPIPLSQIDAVGHRVVHGGSQFQHPVLITPEVKEGIKELFYLAPLHNPQNLEEIEILEDLLPNTSQIAVFDTAFHSTLSSAASTYPGPYSWKESGIKRYGFHGINYEYCTARCSALLGKESLKLVCCHLGNGASMAAIENHQSIDTTMGFTPLEGLMMGSRCGSIDPGILLFLEHQRGQSSDELFQDLNHRSGLLGISGISSDMREIIKRSSEKHPRALLSLEMYIHSLKKNIGAMAAVLGGMDALIFTAGIGENASLIRQEACKHMQHLGIILDEKKNVDCRPDMLISSQESAVKVAVIAAQEAWCIACTIKKMRDNGTV